MSRVEAGPVGGLVDHLFGRGLHRLGDPFRILGGECAHLDRHDAVVLRIAQRGGFRGIQNKSLVDIIQLECLSQNSLVLRVTNGPLSGKIWINNGEVIDAESYSSTRSVTTADGKAYTASALIVASGLRNKVLGIPGEEAFQGKGVIHCAFCDAGLYRGQNVVVCGGGDAGFKLPQVVGGAGEQRMHGADAPAHVHRRFELYQRRTDHHAHVVGGTDHH